MDANTIMQLISSVGFPIVCCGALFWKMNKDDARHVEEMEKITEALNNNTLALQELANNISNREDS